MRAAQAVLILLYIVLVIGSGDRKALMRFGLKQMKARDACSSAVLQR